MPESSRNGLLTVAWVGASLCSMACSLDLTGTKAPPKQPRANPVTSADVDDAGLAPDLTDAGALPDPPQKPCDGDDACCKSADADSDRDGSPDCMDECPANPAKRAEGQCGCDAPDTDTDDDGTADCLDGCDTDPGKIEAGQCGCGMPDADRDGDGLVDCKDLCPDDANKRAKGACGCGVPDDDSDGDRVADCNDLCPDDPGKIEPGACDCGVPDSDRDSDGTVDCKDLCPDDPKKTAPGACDCGTRDVDINYNDTADCHEDDDKLNACSTTGSDPQSMEMAIENRCGTRLQVIWVNQACEENPLQWLDNGKKFKQRSYEGHAWKVVDQSGRVAAWFVLDPDRDYLRLTCPHFD